MITKLTLLNSACTDFICLFHWVYLLIDTPTTTINSPAYFSITFLQSFFIDTNGRYDIFRTYFTFGSNKNKAHFSRLIPIELPLTVIIQGCKIITQSPDAMKKQMNNFLPSSLVVNGLFELIDFLQVSEKSHLIKGNCSKSASKLDFSRNRLERATKQLRSNPKNRSISLLQNTSLTHLSDQQQTGQQRRGGTTRTTPAVRYQNTTAPTTRNLRLTKFIRSINFSILQFLVTAFPLLPRQDQVGFLLVLKGDGVVWVRMKSVQKALINAVITVTVGNSKGKKKGSCTYSWPVSVPCLWTS